MSFMPDSVVAKSGQAWKLVAGGSVLVIAGCVLAWGLWGGGSTKIAAWALLVGLLSMPATWFALRCPKCGARWLWMAVSKQKSLQWLDWLYAQKVCPRCGHDPGREGR